MAKAKGTIGPIKGRGVFRELTDEQREQLSPEEQKKYDAKLKRHIRQQEKKSAMENAGKLIEPRMLRLERALKTNVVRKGDLACDVIDATFVSPCKRTMYATEDRLVRFFDQGDLIQLNCHAAPRAKVPCVVVQNDVFYFAQKKGDDGNEYANLDSLCSAETATLIVSSDEYIGEIVNVITNPKRLFENKHNESEKPEEK